MSMQLHDITSALRRYSISVMCLLGTLQVLIRTAPLSNSNEYLQHVFVEISAIPVSITTFFVETEVILIRNKCFCGKSEKKNQ